MSKAKLNGSKIYDYFRILICLLILFIPLEMLEITSIYTIEAPDGIGYKYRNFYFSIFQFIIIIWAIFLYKRNLAIKFEIIILLIGIKDIIYVSTGRFPSNLTYDISLYLVMLTSLALCIIILSSKSYSLDYIEKFVDIYTVVAIISQLLRMILGMSTDGRYGAIGLSVGGTGFYMALYVLFSLCVKKKIGLITFAAFVSLILSGQRTNMFMCIMFCALYIFISLISKNKRNNRNVMTLVGIGTIVLVCLLVVILIALASDGKTGFNFLDRTFEAFGMASGGELSKEDSVDGRFMSILAASQILEENPLGISNVFYELQYRMSQFGYPTFPHSFVIANSLLWSPIIVAYCFFWVLMLTIRLIKQKSLFFMIPLYFLIASVVWGSPLLDHPMLFLILILLSYVNIVCINNRIVPKK